MIRSTKTTLKFSNPKKLDSLHLFIDEYRNVVSQFVDLIWNEEKLNSLLPKTITSKITDTWLTQRAIQCAGKQASGIVRGTRKKQEQRLFVIKQLRKENKDASKLQKIYDQLKTSKPNINQVEPELDSRFIKITLENETTFDGWITLTCLGNKLKLEIPFKKHKHFNKMLSKGTIKSGIRLSNKMVTFMFDIEDVNPVTEGITLGIDIGMNTALACSNGQMIREDKHGHSYKSICERLAGKKNNSKGFKRSELHRSNYINWTVNQINFNNVLEICREDIKNLRKGRSSSREMCRWNYAELFDKLDMRIRETGVQLTKINATYTSQRCSCCGWVRKSNRKKMPSGCEFFKCTKCAFECNADLNASINIASKLKPIGNQQRLKKANIKGFYWLTLDQERTVPDALKN